jgi:hypothetical protein
MSVEQAGPNYAQASDTAQRLIGPLSPRRLKFKAPSVPVALCPVSLSCIALAALMMRR